MNVIDELEGICEEVVVACFEVIFRHLPAETD
jgi:hypothetical protein